MRAKVTGRCDREGSPSTRDIHFQPNAASSDGRRSHGSRDLCRRPD